MSEQVEHPDHYRQKGRKECWDEFVDRFGVYKTYIWCLLTAEKYLYRAGLKEGNPAEQDIRKARQYADKAESIAREHHRELVGDIVLAEVKKDIDEYGKD